MGVCNEERPVMHWQQQSARFFGPVREQSPTLPATTGIGGVECATRGTTGSHLLRPCATCPDICEHGPKGYTLPNNNNNNNYNDSCRGYRTPDRLMYDENMSPQSANSLLHHHHHHHNHNNHHHPHLHPNNNHPPHHPPPNLDNNYVELTNNNNNNNNNINNNNKQSGGGVECIERTSLNCSGGANSNNNDSGLSNNDYNLPLKSEPIGGPGTPDSLTELGTNPDDCAGCGQLIQDRFYLSAVEKRWHAGCLQCCMCRQLLEGETSCYSRDENIYCKTDYYRLFGNRRCARCLATISSSEMVMRARHLVFHVRCFSCAICNTLLTKGDQCGMRDSTIYCRLHYDITLETESMANQSKTLTMSCQQPQPFGSSPLGSVSPGGSSIIGGGGGGIGGGGGLGPDGKLSASYYGGSQHSLPGLTQPPRQKGRPRKRKPKDLEAMTANLDLSTEYLDLSYGRGGHGLSGSSRTKRMRTSFKHHQLRTMKSYFAINHNPDAKDLKQLSQKTGLPKRVLQVWFQNARAKWRRMMMKQEGKSSCGGGPESEKGDMSLDLDSYSDHSPSFLMSGPHSPHSMD